MSAHFLVVQQKRFGVVFVGFAKKVATLQQSLLRREGQKVNGKKCFIFGGKLRNATINFAPAGRKGTTVENMTQISCSKGIGMSEELCCRYSKYLNFVYSKGF